MFGFTKNLEMVDIKVKKNIVDKLESIIKKYPSNEIPGEITDLVEQILAEFIRLEPTYYKQRGK